MTQSLTGADLRAKLLLEIDRLCDTIQTELRDNTDRDWLVTALLLDMRKRNPSPETMQLVIAELLIELANLYSLFLPEDINIDPPNEEGSA